MLRHETLAGAMLAALVGISFGLSIDGMAVLRALVAISLAGTLLVAADVASLSIRPSPGSPRAR